jgi:uncharacterized protein (DUF3820 family)
MEIPDITSAPAPLTDECMMSYGKKYRGIKMKDVPVEYLEWMIKLKTDAPRVNHGVEHKRVMDYIKKKGL